MTAACQRTAEGPEFRNGENVLCLEGNPTAAVCWEYNIHTRDLLGGKRIFLIFKKPCGNTTQQYLIFHSFRHLSSLVSSRKGLILITLKILKDNALCGSVHTTQGRTI